MPKGKHKGGRRCFTNFDDLKSKQEKEEKEKAWRKARGESDTDEDGSGSESESSEESESEGEVRKPKPKGAEALIEIENPNHVAPKVKKISALDTALDDSKPQLSRKEREEIDKQKKAANYRKLHAAGKTDEARADLERLALIRKQREEAQKKKEEEKSAKMAAAEEKKTQLARALNKKR